MAGQRVLVVAAAVLAGCVHEQVLFGERVPAACVGAGAGSERCTGWILDRLMMSTSYHAYDDRALEAYVSRVGTQVARAAGDTAAWTFRVLDDPTPQAFVNLGRVVYVDRGAIAALRDEAELAALLAHEIAHLLAQHQRESFAEANRGLARWGRERAREIRYARDDEIQADELAVRFVAAAGYDPTAVERMLRALGALSPRSGQAPESRHPEWLERVARVQALAAAYSGGRREERAYLAHLRRVVVGHDPRRAAIVDGVAVFGRAGIAVPLDGPAVVATSGSITTVDGVQLQVLPSEVAPYVTPEDAALHHAGAWTLVVTTSGLVDPRGVVARVRKVRADEQARLVPTLVDLGAPRPLWPAAPAPVTASRRSAR